MVYFNAQGRLGNVMLIYAAARGCARAGEPISAYILQGWSKVAMQEAPHMFKDVRIVKEVPQSAVLWREKEFSFKKIERSSGGDDLIWGTFLSEKYFDKEWVRKTFGPTDEIQLMLRREYGKWLALPEVTSISVRRGDYMRQQHGFPFVGKNFFRKCMSAMPEVKHFIVSSDDVRWCKRYFSKAFPDRHFYYPVHRSILQDLYLPSLCKHNIISNSTFSWWGAWLNANPDKRVLAPSHWFGFAHKDLDTRDVYFEGTEIIQNKYDMIDGLHALFSGYIAYTPFAMMVKDFFRPLYNKIRANRK